MWAARNATRAAAMSSFKIEKNVPPPAPKEPVAPPSGKPGRPMEYPWGLMEPGDSVLLAGKVMVPSSSIALWRKKHPGQQFRFRKEAGGIRVWRVA